jgi:acyl-CoA synthetase (AMP-forming)/AMP-acid ligase II
MGIQVLLDLAVAACPDRVAVGSRRGGLTFGELDALTSGAAAAIADSGARSVVFLGLNGPAFVVALFASAKAGVPLVPLNYRFADDRLQQLVLSLDDPLIVADPAFLGHVAVSPERLLSTEVFLRQAEVAAFSTQPHPEGDAAVILFTSGTTSAPKGVVLRHDNLISYTLQTVDMASAGDDECALVSVPPYHVAGIASVLTNTYAGRRVVHLPNIDPQSWLDIIREEGVTSAMIVPTVLARIVNRLGGQPAEVPTLRTLAYGGARLPRPVLERALAAFPACGFTNAYGLTETSSTIAVLGPDDHRDAAASADEHVRARLGSAGRPVPGIELVIRDADGNQAPAGTVGEIWVRGPQVSGEYLGLGNSLDADGWFPTRDSGRLDEDGYLFIEGRNDDTIIRGGENIAPTEIEDVLMRHPAVQDAGVAGIPDDEWGERIAAAVVLKDGAIADEEGIRQWTRSHLRGSKTPDIVVIWPELPYNALGKLLRRDMAAAMTAAHPRAAPAESA